MLCPAVPDFHGVRKAEVGRQGSTTSATSAPLIRGGIEHPYKKRGKGRTPPRLPACLSPAGSSFGSAETPRPGGEAAPGLLQAPPPALTFGQHLLHRDLEAPHGEDPAAAHRQGARDGARRRRRRCPADADAAAAAAAAGAVRLGHPRKLLHGGREACCRHRRDARKRPGGEDEDDEEEKEEEETSPVYPPFPGGAGTAPGGLARPSPHWEARGDRRPFGSLQPLFASHAESGRALPGKPSPSPAAAALARNQQQQQQRRLPPGPPRGR